MLHMSLTGVNQCNYHPDRQSGIILVVRNWTSSRPVLWLGLIIILSMVIASFEPTQKQQQTYKNVFKTTFGIWVCQN